MTTTTITTATGTTAAYNFSPSMIFDVVSGYTLEIFIGAVTILMIVQVFTPANPVGSTFRLFSQFRCQEKALTSSTNVNQSIDEYNHLHSSSVDTTQGNASYRTLVNSYYDLATIFYEWGWGTSFHFANRYHHESFDESIRRHEYYLASRLMMGHPTTPTMTPRSSSGGGSSVSAADGSRATRSKILDVGCGIGGPMRNICRFTGADVTGITLNHYQVQRGNELCHQEFGQRRGRNNYYDNVEREQEDYTPCRSIRGDFMSLPFPSHTFDGAYAIEATCHAPDRIKCYGEIYRVLKPGAIFACYEWCMTDGYDRSANNPEHERIKKQIEEGDGLPDIVHTSVCLDAMRGAGFEVVEERDMAHDDMNVGTSGGKPWYLPLCPSWNPFTQRFQFNWLGMILTKYLLKVLEFLFLAPRGTSKTQMMLQKAAIGLAEGGKQNIFTPMYLMVGRVPLDKKVHQDQRSPTTTAQGGGE